MDVNRRRFGKALLGGAASYGRIVGANERLGFALVGSGRRGRDVMKAFLGTGRAHLAVIADVYNVQRDRARQALGTALEVASDEEALAKPGVDAVLIASPDHLHLSQASRALRAAKHVFLEKPMVHSFEQGAALRGEVHQSGRVLQAGQQQRSGAHYLEARERYFASGRIGKVAMVRTNWSNFPWQTRRIAPGPKPGGLDWRRFLGPAPYVPWSFDRYDAWRYFPDYGGGVLADIFTHWADVAQWFMGDASPVRATALGGIYQLNDGRGNPDTVNAIVQYKGWNLSFESTVLPVRDDRPTVVFHGTGGTLDIARDGYVFTPAQGAVEQAKATGSLEAAHGAFRRAQE